MIAGRDREHPRIVSASTVDRLRLVATLALLAGCSSSSNEPPRVLPCPQDGGRAGSGGGGADGGAGKGADAGGPAEDAPRADAPADARATADGADAPAGEAGDALAPGDARAADGPELPCTPAPADERVLKIAVGGDRACAILTGGVLKCWGLYGQWLGLGATAPHGSTPGTMGANLPPVDLGTGRSAVAVSLGSFHTCVLLDDATVKCFGDNGMGQLGYGDTSTRGDGPNEMGDKLPAVDLGAGKKVASVCAGYGNSCALLTNGQVKCWGHNDGSGDLGYGDTVDRGGKPGEMGDALPAVDLGTGRSAVAVACGGAGASGYEHVCVLLDDGSVKCWGANLEGELGQGDRTARGNKPNQMGDALPPVSLGTGRKATAVSAGAFVSCALLDDHSLKCWGGGDYVGLGRIDSRGAQPGQMGDALPAVDLGTGRHAVMVSAGGMSTCALLDDGHVKCWGINWLGILGYGDTVERGIAPRQMGDYLPDVDVGACRATGVGLGAAPSGGGGQSCALLENGTLKCWGQGGVLGIGNDDIHGEMPGQMGDNLPTVKLFSDEW